MDKLDIIRFALILAEQAEIEGMKARNREGNIDKTKPNLPTFDKRAFWLMSQNIRKIINMNEVELLDYNNNKIY